MFEMFKKKKDNDLYAPVTGETIKLENVPDKMFADKLMGDGIAFKFDGNMVCAPCDGEISMIANTLHAFGITAENGVEILVHIGLDTVNLKGNGFKAITKAGKKVKKGTPIIEIDKDIMKQNNVNLITPMIITNCNNFNIDIEKGDMHVIAGESRVIYFR
ncbi:PTS system, D-glucosamine-specific IIA component [Clostridium acidisoli DSM 12555]|uniref:PTS system, D-glucosamine-specific IIA component n=1 Tax=Clostridium acidisoli DSM 12555 TaxID=1121291 RepID=A0A1W1XHD8_9CLOT|nr:PTS glucose transporter subunit IIA [Clostridium acidisoli]SMC22921.1 PTS system, D-glucosamine-specific IIA component [Clostridium acidisoli DSM 12555]